MNTDDLQSYDIQTNRLDSYTVVCNSTSWLFVTVNGLAMRPSNMKEWEMGVDGAQRFPSMSENIEFSMARCKSHGFGIDLEEGKKRGPRHEHCV